VCLRGGGVGGGEEEEKKRVRGEVGECVGGGG